VVYERIEVSTVVDSPLLAEAGEAATAGRQGPKELTTASSS
jgi:hypothetical protein